MRFTRSKREQPEDANFQGTVGNDRYPQTIPVKHFNPNQWGLFDMSRNIWESTADWFSGECRSFRRTIIFLSKGG